MSFDSKSGTRVLLVEDDPLVGCTIRKCLERNDYFVQEVGDCASAERTWLSSGMDMVVMDYRLPDGFGVDVVRRMRERGVMTPVICLTAESEKITPDVVGELGISAVLDKPVDFDVLLEQVGGIETRNSKRDARGDGEDRGSTRSVSGGADSGDNSEFVGRFCVERCPELMSVGFLKDMIEKHEVSAWLAFDMAAALDVQHGAMEVLADMAEFKRRADGRLYLFNISENLSSELMKGKQWQMIDVVGDADELFSESRRLMSVSERSAVLGSVVERVSRR